MDVMQYFQHLTEFGYTRTYKEAGIFYVAYLVLSIILGIFVTGLFGLIIPDDPDGYGGRVSSILTIVFCMLIMYLIMHQKKWNKNFTFVGLILLTGILSFSGGGFFGLLLPAYLTTQRFLSIPNFSLKPPTPVEPPKPSAPQPMHTEEEDDEENSGYSEPDLPPIPR